MKIEILLSLIGVLVTLIAAFIAYLQLKNSKKNSEPQLQQKLQLIFEMLVGGIGSADDITNEEIDEAISLYELRPVTGYRKRVLEMLKAEYQKRKQTEMVTKIDSLLSKRSLLPETKEDLSSTTKSGRRKKKMKIGEFVQECFRKAFEQNLITEDEITKLQTPEYSKSVFNQRFEILRKTDKSIKDELGYDRYYKKELFCGNYHLTSFWIETHYKPFKKWLRKINFDYEKMINDCG
jgi:hypothetical protein